jgi:hypothetical protein
MKEDWTCYRRVLCFHHVHLLGATLTDPCINHLQCRVYENHQGARREIIAITSTPLIEQIKHTHPTSYPLRDTFPEWVLNCYLFPQHDNSNRIRRVRV